MRSQSFFPLMTAVIRKATAQFCPGNVGDRMKNDRSLITGKFLSQNPSIIDATEKCNGSTAQCYILFTTILVIFVLSLRYSSQNGK